MRSREEMKLVRELLSRGMSAVEVSRRTGISPYTIRRWRRGEIHAFGERPKVGLTDWRPADAPAYAYLLGLYLGDGCVSIANRTALLQIALDSAYPEVVSECSGAIDLVMPGRRVRVYEGDGVTRVQSASKCWLDAFPQHGPGRKHERRIELADWQQEIVDRHPKQFLRGLIHSDGCRTVNRFKTRLPRGRVAEYAYPRYFFSNLSPDIRGLFCASCDRLGIRWSQSNHRNVSIAHRPSVALLDEFVGPKR